jgi:ribosomal protein S18 acetylase RimI-like enzyme
MVEVRRLSPSDLEEVARLFECIGEDETAQRFHPHPFDLEHAAFVASYSGRDLYVGAFVGERMVGYGMLRGWDDGYAIPSLGIYIMPESRGSGLSREFMRRLHELAALNGSERIMLKVYPDNVKALRLYESLGYQFQSESGDQLVGFLDLPGKLGE